MRMTVTALLLAAMSVAGFAEPDSKPQKSESHVAGGELYEYRDFPTQLITPRNIYVWVPEGYDKRQKYDVVYMHDGQMLFDAATTWNHQEWQVDETVSRLLQSNKIRNCIIVGVWNIPEQRFYDYFPQKTLEFMKRKDRQVFCDSLHGEKFDADNYLRFLVHELKPYIDSQFSTHSSPSHTFLMGSSMGGLISLYGLCEYPDVFGGAACLSIHSLMITSSLMTPSNIDIAAPAFCRYLKSHLPKANSAKIYLDFGNKTLDGRYESYQDNIDKVLRDAGWRRPSWTTNYYPGMSHSETDWAKRLFVPMMFLLETED